MSMSEVDADMKRFNFWPYRDWYLDVTTETESIDTKRIFFWFSYVFFPGRIGAQLRFILFYFQFIYFCSF